MPRISIKTDFKEVYEKLNKIENAMQKKKDILEEIGKTCSTEIRALAPKDTGALIEAIDYKVLSDDVVEFGLMHDTSNPEGNHRSTLVYGVYQEFGTHKMSRITAPSYRNVCWII